ncbi:unnamed protein product [Auanema sp. JU1783]|nr:unnamed protein product [Auanema sp. JU1783]
MKGFKFFLVISQILSLAIIVSALLYTTLLEQTCQWIVFIFTITETIIFCSSIVYVIKPRIKLLIVFLSFQIANALAGIILGLTVVIRDSGYDCHESGNRDCGSFGFTKIERFQFFWFIVIKSTFALFLSLMAIAYSPQVHDFLGEEHDCERDTLNIYD